VSIWKKIKIVEERERAPFYEFTPGKHRLKFVEVVDLDKPFEQEFRGRTRYIMRTVVQDLDTEEYYRWWLDVTQFWNPEEDTFFVPRKSKAYSAALLRHAAEVGGLEDRSFEVEVTGTGRERRYSIKPIEVQLRLEEVVEEKPPEEPPVEKPPAVDVSALREDFRKLLGVKVPEELAIETLSKKYSVPVEEVEKAVKYYAPAERVREVAREAGKLRRAAEASLRTLEKYGTMKLADFRRFVEETYGVSPSEVIKHLGGKVTVEKDEIRPSRR